MLIGKSNSHILKHNDEISVVSKSTCDFKFLVSGQESQPFELDSTVKSTLDLVDTSIECKRVTRSKSSKPQKSGTKQSYKTIADIKADNIMESKRRRHN